MTTIRDLHAKMEGDRIACQARKVETLPVAHGSSTHKIQRLVLKHNAVCVIEKQLKVVK